MTRRCIKALTGCRNCLSLAHPDNEDRWTGYPVIVKESKSKEWRTLEMRSKSMKGKCRRKASRGSCRSCSPDRTSSLTTSLSPHAPAMVPRYKGRAGRAPVQCSAFVNVLHCGITFAMEETLRGAEKKALQVEDLASQT
eukprot:767102-Hanusia_phi.AAC.11